MIETDADRAHEFLSRFCDDEGILFSSGDQIEVPIKAVLRVREELTRLRHVLKQIQSWDCLNPPDSNLCADLPWLKQLVDRVLSGS